MKNLRQKTLHVLSTLASIIPHVHWWPYASTRLGTFIMVYAATNVVTFVGMGFAGMTPGIGALFVMLPISIFIAIRISGKLTKQRQPKIGETK